MILSLTIPGNPIPLARARVAVRGKYPVVYDPPKNKQAKQDIATLARIEMGSKEVYEKAIQITITFHIEKPPSKIRKRTTPYPYPCFKPDIDNLGKLVLDALNGIAYKDDAQCVQLTLFKQWADSHGARTEVLITKY